MQFDAAQSRAVRHKNGPMMVLAGPGSGKTTVITGRLRFLTEEAGIPAEEIMVLTFTRAAAEEMERRYHREAKGAVCFGTFHSVFFMILKDCCGFTKKSIITEKDKYRAVRMILREGGIPLLYTDDFAALLLSEISRVKNRGGLSQDFVPRCCDAALFAHLYQAYNALLRAMRLLDFDDMMLLCLRLFEERPETLSALRRRYRYFLIDEFQDINRLQYRIIRLLSAPFCNLFIVGDDDQSIYGFRGSDPGIMLHFPEDYPGTKSVLLDRNYRSGAEVVKAAQRLIRNNRLRFKKQLCAGRELSSSVRVHACETETEEMTLLLSLIHGCIREGIPEKEIAVLYRTNAEAVLLKKTLGDAALFGLHTATFHASKGLEFEVVCIIDANEGITPHKKSADGTALEEERRMMYVAATRAKKRLHILFTKQRYNRPQKKSRFVTELTEADGIYGRIKGFGGR